MNIQTADVVIVGAGPVGLMCAYLGQLCGIKTIIMDNSPCPLSVGRADAFNARTLQFFELVNIFSALYPLGKKCNTSSVWENGKFISRQNTWWETLEGCFHKHFLMLGQAHLENLLDAKLNQINASVKRSTTVIDIKLDETKCLTTLSNGEQIHSNYLIGADGSRSFVRALFKIPFHIIRPQIIWVVIDGVIDSDFPKVPDIIIFQTETSEVAWIPREENIDRFYIRVDTLDFNLQEAIDKINRAIAPHSLRFEKIIWCSHFSVKESVAEKFFFQDRIFLAGDACHIHSVNGGQGLNTGLADAFNLMWKLNMVINFGAKLKLLQSYENERKPVAHSVIESSAELVRSTKYSEKGTHAKDYVKILEKRSGNVTGMGIRYGTEGINGMRLFDLEVFNGAHKIRLYSLLDYTRFVLLIFGKRKFMSSIPAFLKVIQIYPHKRPIGYWTNSLYYTHKALLVRPDAYIECMVSEDNYDSLFDRLQEILHE